MAGRIEWWPNMAGAQVKTGVLMAADVESPQVHGPTNWLDFKAPSTWATVWFLVAVVYLLKVL